MKNIVLSIFIALCTTLSIHPFIIKKVDMPNYDLKVTVKNLTTGKKHSVILAGKEKGHLKVPTHSNNQKHYYKVTNAAYRKEFLAALKGSWIDIKGLKCKRKKLTGWETISIQDTYGTFSCKITHKK